MNDDEARTNPGAGRLRQWLWRHTKNWISLRRKRFWILFAVLAYTLIGFLLVPWIFERQVVHLLGTQLERPVRIEGVRFNPYLLSLEARGFAITEADGSPLVAFERLYVDFQLSSLFRWAWTFREITLERPRVEFVRFPDGSTNLGRLAGAAPAPESPDEPPDAETGLVRIVVQQFDLIEGSGRVTDQVPATTFSAPLGPIDVTMHEISTLPDAQGRQQVVVRTERGGELAWQGTLGLAPLHSAGRFTAEGPFLPLAYRYAQDALGFRLEQGELELGFEYEATLDGARGLAASVRDLELALLDVRIVQDGQDVVLVPEVRLEGGHAAYPEQTAGAARLFVRAPELFGWLEPDGTPSVLRMTAPGAPGAPGAEAAARGTVGSVGDPAQEAPASPSPTAEAASSAGEGGDAGTLLDDWVLALERFELIDLALGVEDRTLRRPGRVEITNLDMAVDGLDNTAGARFPVVVEAALAPKGELALAGAFGVLPTPVLDAELSVEGLGLAALQPYVDDVVDLEIEDGHLDATVDLKVTAQEPLGARGELRIRDFAVRDRIRDQRLLAFRSLSLAPFDVSAGAAAVAVSEVLLEAPYVRLDIARDGTTNFGALLASGAQGTEDGEPEGEIDGAGGASAPSPEEAREPAALPVAVTVGRIRLEAGSADFSDLALPLPFRTNIMGLRGELSALDTASAEPVRIRIEGQVADYGLARIEGGLLPLGPTEQTDIDLLFRNVELPDLTPYTIRFAGREIDEGRMDVELEYRLEGGRLVGRNNIVVGDLVLGEKVQHPDAMDLPLGMAVALLKGPDGTIDLEVPVEGNVDDPQFRIAGVVMGAFRNVIGNVVASPFKLLGSLVGAGDSAEFGQIEFEPGSAEVTPPEREKLHKLAEALSLRPQLALDVSGAFDPEADLRALKERTVAQRIEQALAGQASAEALLRERRRAAVESLFAQNFPEVELESVQAAFRRPEDAAAPDGAQVLDSTAYVAELERRLVEHAPVGAAELEALAAERVAALHVALLEDSDVDPGRIRSGAPVPVDATDDGWIRMELDVSAD